MNALPSPPSDGITCLSYLPDTDADNSSKLLACSSWDGTVRLYDTTALTNVCIQSMDSGPVLSLAVGASGGTLFTGGLDGSGMLSMLFFVCVLLGCVDIRTLSLRFFS